MLAKWLIEEIVRKEKWSVQQRKRDSGRERQWREIVREAVEREWVRHRETKILVETECDRGEAETDMRQMETSERQREV